MKDLNKRIQDIPTPESKPCKFCQQVISGEPYLRFYHRKHDADMWGTSHQEQWSLFCDTCKKGKGSFKVNEDNTLSKVPRLTGKDYRRLREQNKIK